MSIDISPPKISIALWVHLTPKNPIDVLEGEISIDINRLREG